MQAKLVDGLLGGQYPLSETTVVTIGRGPGNGISLPELHEDNDKLLAIRSVSRKHAEIMKEGKNYIIRDAGSTNGTSVNGRYVYKDAGGAEKFVVLTNGAKIELGRYPLKFIVE